MICVLGREVKAMELDAPLGVTEKTKINQTQAAPTAARVAAAGALVVLLPAPAAGRWPSFPHSELLRTRWRRRKDPPRNRPGLVTDLPDEKGTRAVAACVTADADAFTLLDGARRIAARALERRPGRVLIHCAGLDPELQRRAGEALVTALLTAACPMPRRKRDAKAPQPLKGIDIHGLEVTLDIARIRAEVQGNHLARWLTALPPNELTPGAYRRLVQRLARSEGWTSRFLDRARLARDGAGAFLAVVQGSDSEDAGILHLRYRPGAGKRGKGKAARPALALVGKGICFDTGGVNVKGARHMHGMHEDMEGSAVALGTFLALSRIGVDFAMDCWLALAENHVGPRAYKPNDVVTAADGTSIEIVNTDAEGRMVLADTLHLAGRKRPGAIVDYATLTGACVYALSTRVSGAFTDRRSLEPVVLAAGRDSGERVWPFPMDPDYDEALDSDVADVRQCPVSGQADHIYAARFLKRFVPEEAAWVHVDLSSGNHKGGLGHVPTDVTGFGVRFTVNLVVDQGLLGQA